MTVSFETDRARVVECVALTKVFQDFWGRDKVLAVDRLDVEIHAGEVFGLLGPNGSGKTTTIKILLGLLYPTSGVARVFGRPPTETSIKARIGFMPEESYLYRYLSAYETLDYYGRLFKLDRHERRRRTDQLIEMVGLKRAGRRPVGTYSKGMARRIGLAQALVNDPDLLILDEPTTGLDPIGTRQIKDLIRTLGDHGKTVLLCSHLLADVEDVCDRVAIMFGGRRQALGNVEELLQRRDVTRITTQELDADTVAQVRDIVSQRGKQVFAVDHPTDRLEDLFLRVVTEAHRQKLETSGVEAAGEVAQFLGGGPRDAGEVLRDLVQAGKGSASPTSPVHAPAAPEPASLAAPPKKEVVERLVRGETGETPSPIRNEPIEAPIPKRTPKHEVLEKLLQKPGGPPSSAGADGTADEGTSAD